MQQLGFNLVRLGIEWQALEPGSGGPNQPKICTPGAPGDPREFSQAVADAYLAHVKATVDLLARHGIYTLLDMHQDVYDKLFRGEGAPEWAVCTNNVPIVPKGGRWSNNYSNPQLDTAVGHFWHNDVVGDLQGQFDLVWHTVAKYFKDDPWVIGYDPYNEPFSTRQRRLRNPRSPRTWSASTRVKRTRATWPTARRLWCARPTTRKTAWCRPSSP